MTGIDVVLAAHVIVAGLSRIGPAAITFPAMPPKTSEPPVDAIGAFVSSDGDFCWILTDEVLQQVATTLVSEDGLAWDFEEADVAIDVVCGIADSSGGGLVVPVAVANADAEPTTAAAQRAVAAPLSATRIVVTGDPSFRVGGAWAPVGVPWSEGDQVFVRTALEFRDLVHDARWRYRPAR